MDKLDRSICDQIKDALPRIFTQLHGVKFGASVGPDETNGHLGGYSFYTHGKYWTGKVNILRMADGTHTILFGRFPKNADGKNVWKVDHKREGLALDQLVSVLSIIDTTDAIAWGGVTQAMLRKRKRV